MVEGAMRHGTDMTIESNYVDSHGTLGPLGEKSDSKDMSAAWRWLGDEAEISACERR